MPPSLTFHFSSTSFSLGSGSNEPIFIHLSYFISISYGTLSLFPVPHYSGIPSQLFLSSLHCSLLLLLMKTLSASFSSFLDFHQDVLALSQTVLSQYMWHLDKMTSGWKYHHFEDENICILSDFHPAVYSSLSLQFSLFLFTSIIYPHLSYCPPVRLLNLICCFFPFAIVMLFHPVYLIYW